MRTMIQNEIQLTRVCSDMKELGIKIDREYVNKALNYEAIKLQSCKDDFEKETGQPFRDSPKLLKEVFDQAGETYPTTAKGNPSFRADVLEQMATKTASLINNIRYFEKRASTYWGNYLKLSDDNDIIHAELDQSGARTGRFTCKKPNLQNVSNREDGGEYKIKDAFTAREGYDLYDLDYSSIEYRILADYANEQYLVRRINDGHDVHQATADLLGLTRSQAKTTNFGILYGMGIKSLALSLGCSKGEAKQIRDMYFAKLPNISKFINNVRNIAGRRGYVTNWAGRTTYIDKFSDNYKLVNYLIQGSAADTLKYAMVDIYSELKPRMVITVHDSLLIEAKSKAEIDPIIRIMENSYVPRSGIILKVDAKVGKRWGSLRKVS